VLGGEGGHGMLILSPRAVERLESYTPAWPLPKIFRMTKGGKLIEGIFKGETINTPSMLCVEDYLDALKWAKKLGGLKGLIARADANAGAHRLGRRARWIENLAEDPATRSNTSVCLKIVDPAGRRADADAQAAFAKAMVTALDKEGVASTSAPTAMRRGSPDLVRRDGRDLRSRGADAVARLGLRPGKARSSRPPDRAFRPIRHPGGPAARFPAFRPFKEAIHGTRVLVSDKLSETAVQIFKRPRRRRRLSAEVGKDKEKLLESSASMTASPSARPPRRPRS
jgi:hypothetical protein